jgi:hypothetical protein
MSVFPCCRHGKRADGKLCNAYVSWYFPEDKRWCYYTRWCKDCFEEAILPIIAHNRELGEASETTCIVCSDPVENGAQTFMSLFPPKQPQHDYAFTTCESCFTDFRSELAKGGKLQLERGVGVGAQTQAPTIISDGWAELEL